ncbi:DinB family protein [Vibrio hannami]|uniref:DinB family protein n=1 Tax=Vibrio hannami TaxID=2717094 RepID=UPI00240F1091|nr:DinB family protein [Vibrio hannami]MDG3085941.1 DinB family protein [Vibrio hannami]
MTTQPPMHLCPSISGNIEAIDQGLELFSVLSNENYVYKAKPYVDSSMGEHLRHILDLYHAVINESETGVIDYDHRRRGAHVERERMVGIKELTEIKIWLTKLSESELNRNVIILSEASISTQQVCEMTSTLQRELLFVGSHTIHHFALINVIAKHLKLDTDERFGYAPATATYLRKQA